MVEWPPLNWKVECRSTATEWIAVAFLGQECSPQPPRQEANFRLRPAANCDHHLRRFYDAGCLILSLDVGWRTTLLPVLIVFVRFCKPTRNVAALDKIFPARYYWPSTQVTSLYMWSKARFTFGVKLLECRCMQVWIITKKMKPCRAQSADSSKACRKPRASKLWSSILYILVVFASTVNFQMQHRK